MTTTLLHIGDVAHVRHTPFRHRFRYRMWMLSCDIDAPQESWLFRFNRRAALSLHNRDHGPRDGSAFRPWVEAHLAQAGLSEFGHSVRFMAIPRMFGFAFNPIAFFLCHDARGRLGAVIHQVKNTFGDQTEYVLAVPYAHGTIHQSTGKSMHVSPFFDMKGGYKFAFSDPNADQFRLSIRYGAEAEPRMTAVMRLEKSELTDTALLRLLVAMPVMPFKVFAAIHWEALRLFVRGARYHPAPPKNAKANLKGASA